MKMHTFKGGIYPLEHKDVTRNTVIQPVLPSTKTVCIPISMGGAVNNPIVKPGDTVARGQCIANGPSAMHVPVHASIAGTVKKIENQLVAGNSEMSCIIIQGDDSGREEFMTPVDPFSCDRSDCIKRIHDAGIVGMGGASFPTSVKLSPPSEKKIEYVLLNAAECEPYLTIDERTLAESTDRIIDGLAIVAHIENAHGIIVLETNKRYLCSAIYKSISEKGCDDIISIELVKTKYPQGSERNIIHATLHREIPAGKLPADIGCIVINVGTSVAVSDAFRLGKPLIERGITVSGGAVDVPKNLLVPIGTIVGDLIPEVIQLKKGAVCKIVSGGPMMGFSMTNAEFPVQKGTSGVLFLTKRETSIEDENPCIGCGKCIDVCSCRLNPVMIVRSLKVNDYKAACKFGLMDCVECGSCSYICPAHVSLVQRFRTGKAVEKARRADAVKNSTTGGKN